MPFGFPPELAFTFTGIPSRLTVSRTRRSIPRSFDAGIPDVKPVRSHVGSHFMQSSLTGGIYDLGAAERAVFDGALPASSLGLLWLIAAESLPRRRLEGVFVNAMKRGAIL